MNNSIKKEWTFHGYWLHDQDVDYGEDDCHYYDNHRNPIFKREFVLEKVDKCFFYIASLGYYVVYINGRRLGTDELNSDWTIYQKRVYYDVYDIGSYVQKGNNEIIIEMGNGMYNPSPLRLFGKYNLRKNFKEVGEPSIICDVVSCNQVIVSSDKTWQVGNGQYLFNNLYLGERYDFHTVDPDWRNVCLKEAKQEFIQSYIPKIKRKNSVSAKEFIKTDDGIIVDFQEMISGFIDIEFIGHDGQVITLQYSEDMKNNHLDYGTCLAGSVGQCIHDFIVEGGAGAPKEAIQTDQIICKDGFLHFVNQWTYHSFRYVLIQGIEEADIQRLEAVYVHTDLKQIGTVETDHYIFNELNDAAMRTKLNNIHATFEDCARERLGYGGDMVALATSNLYTFDLEAMYKKVIHDFRLEQTENGGIPETAPYMGIQSNGTGAGEGPLLWQFVYPYLVYKHYQYYGDKTILQDEYAYLNKQLEYLLSYDISELVQHCLGDHGSILIAGQFKKPTPDKLFLGYCTVLLFLKYNMLIGNVLGENMSQYQECYQELEKETIRQFQNTDGSFGEGTQTGYAFAIALKLSCPEKLSAMFVKKIEEDQGIFNSGIFGMALTYEVLCAYGYNEVIENWLLQDSKVSYLEMLKSGNKALAELFVGEHLSLNHAMFASYQQWYYQGLAGIQILEDAIGFDKIQLKPYFSKKINHCQCSVVTKQGKISSSWQRDNHQIKWIIHIPPQVQYEIILDGDYQKEVNDDSVIITTQG